jgi:hypothetical protein
VAPCPAQTISSPTPLFRQRHNRAALELDEPAVNATTEPHSSSTSRRSTSATVSDLRLEQMDRLLFGAPLQLAPDTVADEANRLVHGTRDSASEALVVTGQGDGGLWPWSSSSGLISRLTTGDWCGAAQRRILGGAPWFPSF